MREICGRDGTPPVETPGSLLTPLGPLPPLCPVASEALPVSAPYSPSVQGLHQQV